MQRSLHSFTLFIKERCVLGILFGFISHTNMTNLAKKKRKRTVHSFFRVMQYIFIHVYICIYIYLYISISIYISIYIYKYIFQKRMRVGHAFFSKERNILRSFAFFCKRTLRSLRSFTFFAKNAAFFAFFYILCVLLRS